MKVPPAEFFTRGDCYKDAEGVYVKFTKFNEDGMPTHDAAGEEIKKSALKKLAKEFDKHKKLYENWLKTSGA